MRIVKTIILLVIAILLSSCTEAPLGTKSNPIKLYFVPSMEAGRIVKSADDMAAYLHKKTGYYFHVAVPTSYAAVIEAMGTNEADVAFLATFAYILAHNKYGAEVALTTVRNGLEQYRGQFIARTDSKINDIKDIQGKTIAYTDAASTSGYIYPSAILKKKNITPKNTYMAGGHPQVVLAVYEGNADVGCTFWSPADSLNNPQDARKNVKETHPDIFEKTKIIGFTDWIPNDTVTFRKGMPTKIKNEIIAALLNYSKTKEGKIRLKELYDIDGFIPSDDQRYDIVRTTLSIMGFDANQLIK